MKVWQKENCINIKNLLHSIEEFLRPNKLKIVFSVIIVELKWSKT